jgi:hypothetical protein
MQAVAPPRRQSLLPPPPVAGAPRFVVPLRILHPETARLYGSRRRHVPRPAVRVDVRL